MTTERPGIRARRREHLEAQILQLGRAQLAEVGAPALSVRRIARDLGMASSAVYRYVASRDELLTRLIVESYDALGDAAEAADAAVDRDDLRGRFRAVGHAVREWGRAHPHDWALLYGSPVPGYAAPPEQTVPAGTRVQMVLIRLLLDAVAAHRWALPTGRLEPRPEAVSVAEQIRADLGFAEEALPAPLLLAGVTAWTLMIASVTSEVFEYLGAGIPTPEALFDYALEVGAALVLG